MPNIDCVLNEQLRPIVVEHTEDTNFYTAIYEETSCDPLLESLEGVAYLAKGDEKFHFERGGGIYIDNSGDRRKVIDGGLVGRTLCLRWVGKPDMVFVSYLIEKTIKEEIVANWLREGF